MTTHKQKLALALAKGSAAFWASVGEIFPGTAIDADLPLDIDPALAQAMADAITRWASATEAAPGIARAFLMDNDIAFAQDEARDARFSAEADDRLDERYSEIWEDN